MNDAMTALIFATKREARPFLGLSRAEVCDTHPFVIYRSALLPHLKIMVSGIGKVAAAAACQAMILRCKAQRIVNTGACGLLHDAPGMGIGRLVRITTALEGDHDVFGKRPAAVVFETDLGSELPTARLVTCDRPVFDPQRRIACARMGDVVDMEGAAIGRVAALYGVPCNMLKGISDNACPVDHQTLMHNLDSVSTAIGQYLWRWMNKQRIPDSSGT